jgi:hypothetical protein
MLNNPNGGYRDASDSSDARISPSKLNGAYNYTKDKFMNQILTAISTFDMKSNPIANLKEVAGFKRDAHSGAFSTPASGAIASGGTSYEPGQPLNEEELAMIQELEEEFIRMGNFDRIFPLQHNCMNYVKFFEYKRPSNMILAKYLCCLPKGCNSITQVRRA